MENNQKLGIKVFYYYLSKKISLGIFVLVVSIIVASYKSALISKITFVSGAAAEATISYFIYGLFAVSAILLIFSLLASYINYISCDFTLGDNALNIRRGFLTKREISIPYRQIQNINIDQSFSHKMMGIGRLIILTEGDSTENISKNKAGVFDVIDYALARQIREYILERTNLQMVKDIEPDTEINHNN